MRLHRGVALRGLPVLARPDSCISCSFCVQACVYDAVELQTNAI